MSSQPKPIKIWGRAGLNPGKVLVVLEVLGLPYESIYVPLANVKNPEYTAINPNGRLPAIYDPNTDITLWESGAIVEYLTETYDKENLLSFPAGTKEYYLAKQWIFFQTSGQGPYYGQAYWFMMFHNEKLPSAIARYIGEVNRVTGVLEGHLERQEKEYGASANGPWLVGNKFSYADVMFVPYQTVAALLFQENGYNPDKYPHVKEWISKISSMEKVKNVVPSRLKSE